ncbi:hypothetical protein B296_00028857 [Ensete ventricosum]|uniref:Uncharacterized protein n=1 Tax=Ensete ventricosum TaxID=4639 RepID=A0A426ZGZ2_ENSVE|nr:hypothetical protein B296_00028857 [Ensete ventricosum]
MRCQFKLSALGSLRKLWLFPTRRRPRRGLFRVADGDEISNHRNMLEVRWLSPPKALGSAEGGGKQRRQALHCDEDGDSLATIDHVDQLHLVVGHLCVVQQTSAAGAEEDVDRDGTLELIGSERSYSSVSLAVRCTVTKICQLSVESNGSVVEAGDRRCQGCRSFGGARDQDGNSDLKKRAVQISLEI